MLHYPFGQEHPYEQLPEERFPRQPLAGEPFTVGIVTRPPGAVSVSRVFVGQLGSSECRQSKRHEIANWQPKLEEGVGAEFLERMIRVDQDVWQAQLIAPPSGQTLTYWIEADGELQLKGSKLRGEALARTAA